MRGLRRKRILAMVLAATMILSLNGGVSAESLDRLIKAAPAAESQTEDLRSGEILEPSKEELAEDPIPAEDPAETVKPEPAELPEDPSGIISDTAFPVKEAEEVRKRLGKQHKNVPIRQYR